MLSIPAGSPVIAGTTGQPLGVTTITISVDTRRLMLELAKARLALAALPPAMRDTARAIRQFHKVIGDQQQPAPWARRLALRYQAHRKGRPGWKRIRIPNARSRSWPAFAHDDRADATAAFPLLTR